MKRKEKYEPPYFERFYLPLGLSTLNEFSLDVDEFEPLENGGEA